MIPMPPILHTRSASLAKWIAAIVLLAGAPALQADSVFLYGYTGTLGNVPVDALAQFTLLNDQIQVAIWNLQADTKTVGSTIGAVDFVLSGQQTGGAIIGRSGMEASLRTGSNVTPETAPGGTEAFTNDPYPNWQLTASSYYTNGLQLTALIGNNQKTILGPPNPSTNVFTNVNPSITNHNPYLYTPNLSTPVQFVLSVPGVSANDSVLRVGFNFGASPGTVGAASLVTPEPASFCLVGTGLLGALLWRRKRSKAR
jgi:hypothetical protein